MNTMVTVLKVSIATTVLLLIATFGLFAALPDTDVGYSGSTSSAYSHTLLESDRLMTQRMGVDAQMPMGSDGMLTRSQNPSYLGALEEHSAQVDRMLGRTPKYR